jgi:DNA repair exonuclease SbcCD ATPase subunit
MIAETKIISAIARQKAGVLVKICTDESGRQYYRVAGKRAEVLKFVESQAEGGYSALVPPPSPAIFSQGKEKKKEWKIMSGFAGFFQKGVEALDSEIAQIKQQMVEKMQAAEKQMSAKLAESTSKVDAQAKAFEAKASEKLAGLDNLVQQKFVAQDKKIVESSQKLHTEMRDSINALSPQIAALQKDLQAQAVNLADLIQKVEGFFDRLKRIKGKLAELMKELNF